MSKIRRIGESLSYYLKGILRMFMQEDVFIWCAAIAFKALIAIVPLTILIFGIFGQFLNQADIFRTLQTFLESLIPSNISGQIIGALDGVASFRNALTVIGSLGFFVTGITLFSTLRVVIRNVYGERHKSRPPLRGWASDIRMAFFLGALFLLSLGLTLGLGILNRAGQDFISPDSPVGGFLRETWGGLFYYLRYVLPFATTWILFFLLYYFIPRPRPRVSSAALGALVTSGLWEIAKLLFGVYANQVADFDKYSNIITGALGEILVLLLVLIFWVYYSGIILIIGACIGKLREERQDEDVRLDTSIKS